MFAVGSGAGCLTCSGCETLRPPKASLERAGREAVLCSHGCSADTTLQEGEGKETGRREVRNSGHPSSRWSGGAWESLMPGLGAWPGDRLAPTHAFTGIKALRKKTKPKRPKELFFQEESSHLPLGRAGLR